MTMVRKVMVSSSLIAEQPSKQRLLLWATLDALRRGPARHPLTSSRALGQRNNLPHYLFVVWVTYPFQPVARCGPVAY
jgi:hypothetical protein